MVSVSTQRQKILTLAAAYYRLAFDSKLKPGKNYIPASGKV
ncbi:MAG: hypothetical protein UX73_C0017G0010, partial [candidate division WWE3 bacterium GW2011_GWC1_47_10]